MSNSSTQHGYLVIADISGYTSFVARTELEHSQEILSELLEVLLSQMTTLLTLSKLEGDAVFAYVSEHKVPRSETILELVEATYVAFKDRVRNMNRRTTCTCNACRNIPLLDLKFIVHHGDYIRQDVMGISELIGNDVNLVHRLLKNHVAEATHWQAYALFTQEALTHMGIPLDDAHVAVETYEHLGEVKTYSFNLQERYTALTEARRVFLSENEADFKMVMSVQAPPAIIWTWANDPNKRNMCAVSQIHWRPGERPKGRTGVGARNHCAHGGSEMTETIIDWRPFDYYSAQSYEPKWKSTMEETTQFVPLDNGRATELHYHFRMNMPLPRALRAPLCRFMMTKVFKVNETYANMARMAEQEYRALSTEPSASPADTDHETAGSHEHA